MQGWRKVWESGHSKQTAERGGDLFHWPERMVRIFLGIFSISKFSRNSRGLKAAKEIEAGHFIIEYVGEIITKSEMERRLGEKTDGQPFYIAHVEGDYYLDAELKGNNARFINHSCDANAELLKWRVNGATRVGIFAKETIEAGTEITFNYQMDQLGMACHCGAENCTGFLGK